MIRAVLTSLFRQSLQRPALSLLNLLGLAAGISICALIFLYAHSEMNYNEWVEDQERLYRVEGQFVSSPGGGWATSTFYPLKSALDAEFSEVAISARMRAPQWSVKFGNFLAYENIALVDPEFFEMFDLEIVSGSKADLLAIGNGVLIAESMAQKYFGDVDPVGETLTLDGDRDAAVRGVFADLPERSDFDFDLVMEIRPDHVPLPESWNNINLSTFVRLTENASVAGVHEKFAQLVDEKRPFVGNAPVEMRDVFRLFLQPFEDIHLGSRGRTGSNSMGNYATVYGFIATAILIIIISAFNYVSLATARALEREKEICLRKVMGAGRAQIARQVIGESIAITLVAALVGFLVTIDALPYFNTAVDTSLSASELMRPGVLAVFVLGSMVLGFLAGLYPAFFVAGYRPARFLSGGRTQRAGLARLRQSLVFVQFTVSIGLIIAAVTISRQVAHINGMDMGFERANLAVVRGIDSGDADVSDARSRSFREAVERLPGVISVARSSIVPTAGSTSMEGFFSQFVPEEESLGLRMIAVDHGFFETFGTGITAGRAFDERFAEDLAQGLNARAEAPMPRSINVVLNELAVGNLGFASPEAAVGQQIQMQLDNGQSQPLMIAGVARNMLFRSARTGQGSHFFFFDPERLRNLTVRYLPENRERALAEIEHIWSDMYPETPFAVDFMEDRVARLYQNENQQLQLFMVFSGLTILLSCVGLVGLVLNSVNHRVREISIRRVVGASVTDIIRLFSWQYLKPILIANIPAFLLAWYFLDGWLQNFSRRIELGPELYIMGGGAIALLTLALVALLVIRSALTPPAEALRYE